jgi:hypothetical protein
VTGDKLIEQIGRPLASSLLDVSSSERFCVETESGRFSASFEAGQVQLRARVAEKDSATLSV